jgi:hypothetical protein
MGRARRRARYSAVSSCEVIQLELSFCRSWDPDQISHGLDAACRTIFSADGFFILAAHIAENCGASLAMAQSEAAAPQEPR